MCLCFLRWGGAETVTHPVEGVMMQPPRSTVTLQPHPRSGVSWFIPKLCPSSWARVTAAPRGLSEWSCKRDQSQNVPSYLISPQTSLPRDSELSLYFQARHESMKQYPLLNLLSIQICRSNNSRS